MSLLRIVPPGLVVSGLLVLILSALFYATLPYRRRAYIPILLTTAAGFALGQVWDYLGLPSLRLGQSNVVPAAAFALALQLLAPFIRLPRREPKDPKPSSSSSSAESPRREIR